MGKKYIIELEDKMFHKTGEAGAVLWRAKGFNSLVFDMTGIDKLTPYTEPNLEQVRKEAFKNGYDAACKDIDIKSKINAAYRKGMEDAWEAARTLWNTPNRKEIFGHTTFNTVLTTLTAQEAIEKIKAWEDGKQKINVGDEVKCIKAGWTAIVTKIKEDGYLTLMGNDGAIANGYDEKDFIKTGRRFPEIAEVLRKMKENNG